MKYKIERKWHGYHLDGTPCTDIGGFWAIKYRKHWWNRWRYITYVNSGDVVQFFFRYEAENYIKQLDDYGTRR